MIRTVACDDKTCALRAPTVFLVRIQTIRTKNTVMDKTKPTWGFIQDRRLRTDGFIIRAQSTIRADGFSSAQNHNFAVARDAIQVTAHG
ncbi:MAG: hypothetical protein AAB133_08130 [Pseudomonadota bacterium]